MVHVVCPLCGCDRPSPLRTKGRNRTVVCGACRFFYTDPIPPPEVAHAATATSDRYTEDQLAKRAFFRRRAERLFSSLAEVTKPGRLLDVGCAIGTELEVANTYGWEAVGIELSRASVALGRERGLDIRSTTLHEARFPDASFDLVTLNHVLEHQPDPRLLAREVARVLVPGGLLFVAVPNVHTWLFYLKRGRYTWTFHDDHFVHFTVRTLTQLLETEGYRVLDIETSRWLDHHEPPEETASWVRVLDRIASRWDLGIEIFCTARRLERETDPRPSSVDLSGPASTAPFD